MKAKQGRDVQALVVACPRELQQGDALQIGQRLHSVRPLRKVLQRHSLPPAVPTSPPLMFLLRILLSSAVLLLSLAASSVAADPDDQYQLGPDSQRQPGVPQGKVTKHLWKSNVFEGTLREYYRMCRRLRRSRESRITPSWSFRTAMPM
jgi:hypothetical protein